MNRTHHNSKRSAFVGFKQAYSFFSDMPINDPETIGVFWGKGDHLEERRKNAISLLKEATSCIDDYGNHLIFYCKSFSECTAIEISEASWEDASFDKIEEERNEKIERGW